MHTKIEEVIVAELMRQSEYDACIFVRDDRQIKCGVMVDGALNVTALAAAVCAAISKEEDRG